MKTITLILFLCLFSKGFSQTFSWGNDGYRDYSKGGLYKNIDGSGIDLRVVGLTNDKTYGMDGVKTGVNNQKNQQVIHEYKFIFSEKVNVKFSVLDINLDTIGGWCFMDDVGFSGDPIFTNAKSVTIVDDSLVVPIKNGSIHVEYKNVDTITIRHGKGHTCNPGFVGFTPLLIEKIASTSKKEYGNILFETGKSNLSPAFCSELDELVNYLNEHPDFKIEICGHTDNIGDEKGNLDLSKKRINSVQNYLVSMGIENKNIDTCVHGEDNPTDSNETQEGRKNNRRVEISLVKK